MDANRKHPISRTRVFPSSGTFTWTQIGNIRFPELGCSRVLALLHGRKSETSDFQNSGVPEFWHFYMDANRKHPICGGFSRSCPECCAGSLDRPIPGIPD